MYLKTQNQTRLFLSFSMALLLFSVTPTFRIVEAATPYCERIFKIMGLDLSEASLSTIEIDQIISAMIRDGWFKAEDNLDILYKKMTVKFNRGSTLLKLRQSGEEWFWVINLPKDGEPTIWEHLSTEQKLEFVIALESVYKISKYDYDVKDDYVTALDFLYYDWSKGIKPKFFLYNAAQRRYSGVCRHATCSLSANLVEAGVPRENLRLIIGKGVLSKDRFHIILQVNIEGRWRSFDAVGGNNAPVESEIYYRKGNWWKGAFFKAVRRNHDKYDTEIMARVAEDQRTVTDFFIPVPKSEIVERLELFRRLESGEY